MFKLIRGVRETVQDDDNIRQQLVLPSLYVRQALIGLHNDIEHPERQNHVIILKPILLAWNDKRC